MSFPLAPNRSNLSLNRSSESAGVVESRHKYVFQESSLPLLSNFDPSEGGVKLEGWEWAEGEGEMNESDRKDCLLMVQGVGQLVEWTGWGKRKSNKADGRRSWRIMDCMLRWRQKNEERVGRCRGLTRLFKLSGIDDTVRICKQEIAPVSAGIGNRRSTQSLVPFIEILPCGARRDMPEPLVWIRCRRPQNQWVIHSSRDFVRIQTFEVVARASRHRHLKLRNQGVVVEADLSRLESFELRRERGKNGIECGRRVHGSPSFDFQCA